MAPPSGNASRPGRALAVLAALIVAMFLGVVGSDLVSPGKWHQDFRVHLGLDLTSGTTVSLQAVRPGGGAPTSSQMQQAVSIMENRVNGAGFTGASVEQQGSDMITVSVPGKDAQGVLPLVERSAQLQFRQVLLVAPNTSQATTPTPSPSASAAPSPTSTSSPAPSPTVSPKTSASPSASAHAAGLPGAASGATVEMASRARAAGAAASPSASATSSAQAAAAPSASASPSPSASASAAPTSSLSTWQQAQGDPTLAGAPVKALFDKLNCANPKWQQKLYPKAQWNEPDLQIVSCENIGGIWYKYALDKAKVVGSMIASANATPNTTGAGWVVNVNFKNDGSKAFGQLTSQMFAKYQGSQTLVQNEVAMVLDGSVISAPNIQTSILTGQAQISGSYSQQSAQLLATQLSYGALPLSFHQQQVQSISPQLGHDQLTAGLIAGAIGLGLVVIYLLLYYRGLALIAVSSLILSGLLAYLSVILLGNYRGFSLSLAGIAGLIVAIGITADSFVVYFERLRDEVREGRSLRAAVERGWTRARRTILVSDTVSFLAAALLYIFAVGDVKGFAFTLGLTTIIDVVVVFTFTKPMMTLLARTRFYGRGHPLSGLDPARLGARAPWRGARRPASARTTSAKEA